MLSKEPIVSQLSTAAKLMQGLTEVDKSDVRSTKITKEDKFKKQIENYVKSREGHTPGRVHTMRDGTNYLVLQDPKRQEEKPGILGFWVKVVNTGTSENPVWAKAPKTSKRAKHRAEVAARRQLKSLIKY